MSEIGTKAAAEQLKLSQKTVEKYCRLGYIPNATQDKPGSPWHIPADITLEQIQENKRKSKGKE